MVAVIRVYRSWVIRLAIVAYLLELFNGVYLAFPSCVRWTWRQGLRYLNIVNACLFNVRLRDCPCELAKRGLNRGTDSRVKLKRATRCIVDCFQAALCEIVNGIIYRLYGGEK